MYSVGQRLGVGGKGEKSERMRTVMDTFRDRLEDLEVDKGRAAVVAVVLVLVVAGDGDM